MLRLNWNRVFPFTSGALTLASLLSISGCGTGEYQDRMEKRASELEFTGNFESNLKPEMAMVNADCKLRLPVLFADAQSFQPGAPPPLCNIPGQSSTYEKVVTEGDKTYPFFCYLASTPVPEKQKIDEFKAAIEAEVAKSGASGGKFSSVTVQGPGGAAETWDFLSVTSQQRFASNAPGSAESTVEGRFDLYLRQIGTNYVLVGWRGPTAAAAAKTFFDNAKLSIGAAQVNIAPPKPDLSGAQAPAGS